MLFTLDASYRHRITAIEYTKASRCMRRILAAKGCRSASSGWVLGVLAVDNAWSASSFGRRGAGGGRQALSEQSALVRQIYAAFRIVYCRWTMTELGVSGVGPDRLWSTNGVAHVEDCDRRPTVRAPAEGGPAVRALFYPKLIICRTALPSASWSMPSLIWSSRIANETSDSMGSRPDRHSDTKRGMSRAGTAEPR